MRTSEKRPEKSSPAILLPAFVLLALAGAVTGSAGLAPLATVPVQPRVDASGYLLALPGYSFEFPRDHFDHQGFQTEWWYHTGNLRTEEGRRFGFELTFFRHAVKPSPSGKPSSEAITGADVGERQSPWVLDDVYLAHLALTDIDGGRFLRAERVNRRGPPPGIARASLEAKRIWNGNWSVTWTFRSDAQPEIRLEAVAETFSLQLDMKPSKPPVIHGENGVSQKAEGAGRASHYISFTRLETSGAVTLDGRRHDVNGTAWMDHEFFTHQLAEDQAGWDWFSLQMDDGTELMLYRLRRRDGRLDRFSAGTYIGRDGTSAHLGATDFSLDPLGDTWKSPATGTVYPIRWRVRVPSLEMDLEARALMPSQEMVSRSAGVPVYWEGAIVLTGEKAGRTASGVGYLEMTGGDLSKL